MFDAFGHYLSYGATDQTTLRDLRGAYDGLVVPGTVAAFQHQGTGGFVLTLSATVESAPYVIDPRSPLFQQRLPSPKKSHIALAEVLGSPELVRDTDPTPDDFPEDMINTIASSWVDFNESYRGAAGTKFDKYAARLDEPVMPDDASEPEAILAPYLMATEVADPWWQLSGALLDATRRAASGPEVVRVVAAENVGVLGDLLEDAAADRAVIWVSNLHELGSTADDLATYLIAIDRASAKGQALFALYGGFFSVIAGEVGLRGSSHGIGFGEHRDWPELPRSGPAPPRFYLSALHRYVSQEDAQRLHATVPLLASCDCSHCDGRGPIELEYHDLMKHSVATRAREIADWLPLTPSESRDRLTAELKGYLSGLASIESEIIRNRMMKHSEHMSRWIAALDDFISNVV